MTLDPNHTKFEAEVNAWFKSEGFQVSELTYHRHMETSVKNLLATIYDPTALYIRTRADRVAMRGRHCFEYEVKTRFRADPCDFLIEFFPFWVHYTLWSTFGINCLYVCRLNGVEKGFWADDPTIIETVMIPSKWSGYNGGYFESLMAEHKLKHVGCYSTRGSDDPFIIIPRDRFGSFHDWKAEVLAHWKGK